MTSQKALNYVVLVVVAINLALFAWFLAGAVSPKKPAQIPLPKPNGYDDFVKAGALLNADFDKFKKLDRAELGTLVTNNEEALGALETGLRHQSRVPGNYVWDQNSGTALLPNMAPFKRAAELFAAEGRLAELEGHTNDAARFYLEGIRFGEESARSGVFAEKLIGIGCSTFNAKELEKLLGSLDAKQCADIAKQQEAIDAAAESNDEALQHEDAFVKKYYSFSQRLAFGLMMPKSIKANRDNIFKKLDAWTLKRRHLMLAFAQRAYELDKGQPPANAAALVPEYLKKIPKDPATGADLPLPQNTSGK